MVLLLGVSVAAPQSAPEKNIDSTRDSGLKMLKVVREQIKANYYDPKFHGIDLDARFKVAELKINQALSYAQIIGIIAQTVIDLNDSHTRLVPPPYKSTTVYGWKMQMIGNDCYITAIAPGSDAEAKGLKPGDRIIALDGNEPTRKTMWKVKYYYYVLRPKSQVDVTFETPAGERRQVVVLTKNYRHHFETDSGMIYVRDTITSDLGEVLKTSKVYYEFGTDLIVYRFRSFNTDSDDIDNMMKKLNGHKAAVVDLRANSGGRSDMLERFISYLFNHEVKVGDFKRRKEVKEVKVKPRNSHAFPGDLIVLIDSESKSAAEVFARLVQIEKRGLIVGDRSAGMVMENMVYNYELDLRNAPPVLYGLMITDADIVMSDGKSLEWLGVTPDKLILPTSEDIRNHRDPALAYAASLGGIKITPEGAGALFLGNDPK
jgi:C-terminal processing protease CtpA/Prc